MSELEKPAPERTPEELLVAIWQLSATGLIEALTKKPSAALLNVALKFLTDSGVLLDSLRQLTRTRGGLASLGPLPIFPEDADTAPPPTQAAASAPFDKLEHADAPEQ